MTFKQAEREPDDGAVSVQRLTGASGRERILIVCGDAAIECSFYNASRIFGMLSVMLGISLPKALGKAIKFG